MGGKFLDVMYLWSPLPERPSSPNIAPAPNPLLGWYVCKLWSESLPQIAWGPLCWAHSLRLHSCSLAWCKAWSVCQSRWALQGCGLTESSAGCPAPHRCHRLLLRTNPLRLHGAHTHNERLEWSSSTAGHGLPLCPGPQWGSLDPPQSSWTPPRCSGDSRWPGHGVLCSADYTALSSPNREHVPSGTTCLQPDCLHLEGHTNSAVHDVINWCVEEVVCV